MISTLGNVLQVLTMLVALVAAASLAVGVKTRREGAVNAGYLLVFGNAVALTACVAIILLCFLTRNFSLAYVASNFPQTDSPLLPLYQVAGVWAGRQGSLLFWTWLISVFSAMVAWRRMHVTDDLSSVALAVSEVVVALFCATLVFSESNNPFIATAAQYLNEDGTLVSSAGGMNPLLLHWAMVLHPPATFIGYAGCTIPFAYAMAALITGDVSARWVELSDRVAIFSFIFLTIGMALGAVWAYVVLGWGGFWAWDAVENASLFSWLSAVAMIHSFTMYRKRGCFKRWSMFAAVITFIFVVLGTFITRSGLVQSVHAFAEDPVSTYFFLAIMVLAALLLPRSSGISPRHARRCRGDRVACIKGRLVLPHQSGVHRGRGACGLPHGLELAAHVDAARRSGGLGGRLQRGRASCDGALRPPAHGRLPHAGLAPHRWRRLRAQHARPPRFWARRSSSSSWSTL